jgi:hypothetical protein
VDHNPLDNVPDLAHHFFQRCLEAKVFPYVVTKKTVFKWQEGERAPTCHLLTVKVRFDGWNRPSSLRILFPGRVLGDYEGRVR